VWIYPIVAPRPHLALSGGQPCLSLEPWRLGDYSATGLCGATALLAMLAGFFAGARRAGPARQAAILLSGWILFNWAFRFVWGDERFLYAPHWSRAITVMLLLAGRQGALPRWFSPLAGVLLLAQALALADIVRLVAAIR